MIDSFEVDAAGEDCEMQVRDLCELVYTCAGAATAPLLIDNPDYTFPSERVAEAVSNTLYAMTGIDSAQVPGYAGAVSSSVQPPEGVARVLVDVPIVEGVYEGDPSAWEQQALHALREALTEEERKTLGA